VFRLILISRKKKATNWISSYSEEIHPMSTAVRNSLPEEHDYSVKELAEDWNVSDDFVRSLFENEPGVLIYEVPGRRSRRHTMRIPASVAERVRLRSGQK
jgi:hypothetical protein